MMWALSMCHEIIENAWPSQLLQKWVLFDHGMLKWAYPLPCFFSGWVSWVSKQQQREDYHYRLDLVWEPLLLGKDLGQPLDINPPLILA